MYGLINNYDGMWNVLIQREFNPDSVKTLQPIIDASSTKKLAFRRLWHGYKVCKWMSEERLDEELISITYPVHTAYLLFPESGNDNASLIPAFEMLRTIRMDGLNVYATYFTEIKDGNLCFEYYPQNKTSVATREDSNVDFAQKWSGQIRFSSTEQSYDENDIDYDRPMLTNIEPFGEWSTIIRGTQSRKIIYQKTEIIQKYPKEEASIGRDGFWILITYEKKKKKSFRIMNEQGVCATGGYNNGGEDYVVLNGKVWLFDDYAFGLSKESLLTRSLLQFGFEINTQKQGFFLSNLTRGEHVAS